MNNHQVRNHNRNSTSNFIDHIWKGKDHYSHCMNKIPQLQVETEGRLEPLQSITEHTPFAHTLTPSTVDSILILTSNKEIKSLYLKQVVCSTYCTNYYTDLHVVFPTVGLRKILPHVTSELMNCILAHIKIQTNILQDSETNMFERSFSLGGDFCQNT